ncbi:FtsK/SpoIIIE domain-containing protein [Lysinibacillus sp. FSL W8-0953]|uniref:FtsK/SpoIIIE domain-containing protein n=1 Tax=Lysinibacillus sp. FSL W8-0953 TaxID=2954640 RepID=UPI0030F5E3D9
MLFEILTTSLMGGIALKAFSKHRGLSSNDSGKIQRIMSLSGLNVRDGKDTLTTQLVKKKQFEWGWEYKYRIPLGRSFADYEAKLKVFEDGLNNRRKNITFNDLRQLDFNKDLLLQLQELWKAKLTEQKEIELSYDGLLIVRVYDKPLEKEIKWNESLLWPDTWSVPIGFTRNAEVIFHDFDKSKHLIIAGATGYGKSAILKLITTTLIDQQPNNTELSLIDLKGGSAFHRYRSCKQVKYYSRNPDSAVDVLKKVQIDMQKSFEKVVDKGFEDVKEAGIRKRHFIIIDEAADLAENRTAMDIITDIARRGRSAGYYLIFCTQYPTAQVVPSQTKRNIIARLCYAVDTDTASRVVLDESGADKLPDIPGRGIYKSNIKRYIVQSPFITNEVIQQRIKPHIVTKGERVEETTIIEKRTDTVTFEEV